MRDLPEVPEQSFREWWEQRSERRPRVVLGRIRAALGSSPDVSRGPARVPARPGRSRRDVERFCERVADYKATVHRVAPAVSP